MIRSESQNPDEDVLILAEKAGLLLATLDREVREKARQLGIKVLMFRDGEPYIN